MSRSAKIKHLIETKFAGNKAAFARAIGKNPSQVSHWMNGFRSIGDGIARQIEIALGLEQGSLDNGLQPIKPTNATADAIFKDGTIIEIKSHDPEYDVFVNKKFEFISEGDKINFLIQYNDGDVDIINVEGLNEQQPLSANAMKIIKAVIDKEMAQAKAKKEPSK